jgi:DNA-binding FrmR family transcriptional regulator
MIIDEVDTATNNQVFLDFLAQLRADYLEQEKDPDDKTFQSVILAGVTDIRHLRSKIRDEDQHKVNSPWNIAVEYTLDMDLGADGIQKMLAEDVPCEDILTQLNAANGALHRLSLIILDGHLRHCVREGIENGNADETIESFAEALESFAKMA